MLAPFARLMSLDAAWGLSSAALETLLALGGLLCFVTVWGLWRLHPWGRWLALSLALLDIACSLLSMARWLRAGGPVLSLLPQFVDLVLWAAMAAYLCLPHVRRAFLRQPSR